MCVLSKDHCVPGVCECVLYMIPLLCYHETFTRTHRYTFPDDEKEQKIYNDLMNSSELNMAACKLKTQNYPEVIQHCTSVLRTNSKCVKALLRRSRAYRLSDHFDKALEDLRVAIEVEPSNKILLQEREMLNGQIRGYKNASKKMSAAMFKNKKN